MALNLDKQTIKAIAAVVLGVVVCVLVLSVSLAIWLPTRYYVALEYWPKPNDNTYDVIMINTNDENSYRPLLSKIQDFFKEYQGDFPGQEARVDCMALAHEVRGNNVCDVKTPAHGPCIAKNAYGYPDGTPCVFLRLNQNAWWVPEPYNTSYGLPIDMPQELRVHIINQPNVYEASKIWVSCYGLNSLDKEALGPILYFPDRGFPAYYFPYSSKLGYLSPYVAVFFERPRTGIRIHVECRTWAHNIHYSNYYYHGTVQFKIMVE